MLPFILLYTLGVDFEFFAPVYPPLAAQARISGSVTLKWNAGKSPEVLVGHPLLASACLETIPPLSAEANSQLTQIGRERVARLHQQLEDAAISTIECQFQIVEWTRFPVIESYTIKRPLILKILSLGFAKNKEIQNQDWDYKPLPPEQRFEVVRDSNNKVILVIRTAAIRLRLIA